MYHLRILCFLTYFPSFFVVFVLFFQHYTMIVISIALQFLVFTAVLVFYKTMAVFLHRDSTFLFFCFRLVVFVFVFLSVSMSALGHSVCIFHRADISYFIRA
jgi:hypothetical protein